MQHQVAYMLLTAYIQYYVSKVCHGKFVALLHQQNPYECKLHNFERR